MSLAVAACSKSEEPTVPTDGRAIAFGSYVLSDADDDAATRATLIGADENLEAFRKKPIALYGDWIRNKDVTPQLRTEIFHNQQLIYDGAGPSPAGWNYTPIQYWASYGWYDFTAFWPATTRVMGTATASTLALEYMTATDEDDLMVAYTFTPTQKDEKAVPLNFRHALAAVKVLFIKGETTLPYELTNCYFTSINHTAALVFEPSEQNPTPDLTSAWVAPVRGYVDPVDPSMSDRIRESTTAYYLEQGGDTYAQFNLMIPQSLVVAADVAKPAITFTLNVYWYGLGAAPDEVTTTLELPTDKVTQWEAGKKYTYSVTVQPNKFDVEVRTTKWDEVDATADDIEL